MGVNDGDYDPAKHTIISNASCTTNCLGPLAKVLNDAFGIERGLMTTIHAYTQDQNLQDAPAQGPAPRPRRRDQHRPDLAPARPRRSAWCCPSSRASSTATRCACPSRPARPPTSPSPRHARPRVDEVKAAYRAAADGPLKGILTYTEDPIVSSDIVTDPASCIFDAGLTKVIGNQVKVVGWYDNEWGYSNRLVDLTALVGSSL